ncbi:DUF4236 domain-containing protein [Sphingobacterium sp. N143]|uniref:DUF4236 domain-containing protein n=1 Tax=Sphingobacterium sp. N143 TaxID=2746727 RepID=UPI002578339C|nr:DUF4236 domain-containing protein [Sphingobacterium sp. N143]MDM1295342.1 DUF4236 domain-containing protein [Sphingobacterium sp. N143]
MAWNFRRRVKIIPGVHLNFSKSGISTSIGVKGASMTFGSSGTYLNAGIPALGIYNRQKISGGGSQPHSPTVLPSSPALAPPIFPIEEQNQHRGNIFSADIHEITSQDMQGIKEAILLAREQRLSLEKDLAEINAAVKSTKNKKLISYLLIYGLINKSVPERLNNDLIAQQEAINQTHEQIEASYVDLKVDFEIELQQKYDALVSSFLTLSKSHKIWDVTSAHYEDRVVTRSSASTVVSRTDVRFGIKSIPEFKSEVKALYFQNANGADLYIYPSFIIMYSKTKEFAIIGLDEISLQQHAVRFTETQGVPADSKTIDMTWAKVNKDGSRDKRFTGNYQIPVVRYGEIKLRTVTGVNEEYEFSNYEATEAFANAFMEYQQSVRQLVQL